MSFRLNLTYRFRHVEISSQITLKFSTLVFLREDEAGTTDDGRNVPTF